jgi:hypothetical protein
MRVSIAKSGGQRRHSFNRRCPNLPQSKSGAPTDSPVRMTEGSDQRQHGLAWCRADPPDGVGCVPADIYFGLAEGSN